LPASIFMTLVSSTVIRVSQGTLPSPLTSVIALQGVGTTAVDVSNFSL
jgi:hypothetical protein